MGFDLFAFQTAKRASMTRGPAGFAKRAVVLTFVSFNIPL
jgi:hypothetical protein